MEIKTGILTPLQKPGKKKGPCSNLRPIILLSIIRKILAIAMCRRISDRLIQNIPKSQAAYQGGRGTTEQVFAMRTMAEKAIAAKDYKTHILMMDMSKAFDTVNRSKLMLDLILILDEDEIHMIKILITDVELKVKVGGTIGNGFKTNTGVPQGDCLSPLLFILYLARSITSTQPTNQLTASQVNEHNYHQNKFHEILEPQYADDISWITNGPKYLLEDIKQKIPGKLEQRNLKINKDKTEEFQITYGGEDDWKKVKYLGSLLETNEDIKRRKSLTLTAISNLENIWKNRNVSTDTKYRIYKAVVESIFLYNSEIYNMIKKLHKR